MIPLGASTAKFCEPARSTLRKGSVETIEEGKAELRRSRGLPRRGTPGFRQRDGYTGTDWITIAIMGVRRCVPVVSDNFVPFGG